MSGRFALFGVPVLHPQPRLDLGRSWDLSFQSLPENTTVRGLGYIGENSVSGNGFHGHGIGLN